MKKLSIIISVILCTFLLAGVFSACATTNMHTVTFDLNYEGAPAATVVEVEDNTFVTEPDAPVREHYEFLGWFADKECSEPADLERSVTADMTVYAGWKRSSVSVTFDLNYEGGGTYGEVQSVAIGGIPVRPSNPTRTDYVFTDWYTVSDASEQSDDTRYAFTALSEDTVLYAGWEELSEDTATVRLMWNYDGAPNEGVYSEQPANVGGKISLPVLQRASSDNMSYSLTGWRDDSGNEYAAGESVDVEGDTVLYALWNVVNTYEAEYTDLSYLQGTGWSWNPVGTANIYYNGGKYNASNGGLYVGNLNAKGCYLFFEVYSEEAVSGLTLKLGLSIEAYFMELDLTPELFAVSTATSFDGERSYIDYDNINIQVKAGETLADFDNYLVTENLSLSAGKNYIFLQVVADFTDAGYPELAGTLGAMAAFAPVVDTLVIEHAEGEAQLSWVPRVCNIWGQEGYTEEDGYICHCDKHKQDE